MSFLDHDRCQATAAEAGGSGVSAASVANHVKALLFNPKAPTVTAGLAMVPGFVEVHHCLMDVRGYLRSFSRGDFSIDITTRGVVCGMIKSLQANLNHLIWQMEQVEAGDLTQRVDFMGDFAAAFNSMVFQLDSALTALRTKERELTAITEELRQEVDKREAALRALQQSEENFRYLAEHDPLTGILNRRSFMAQAELELAKNTIMDDASSIAIMDLDHFKQFNDTHGHPAGDRALKQVADLSGAILRPNDIMGRMGGEEFLFFFSKTNIDQARRVAERIRERIAEQPIQVDHGQALITASIGVVSFYANQDSQSDGFTILEQALAIADEALYRAKAAGRNKVRTGAFVS